MDKTATLSRNRDNTYNLLIQDMNPLHLLWICQLCAGVGAAFTCLCVAAGRSDKWNT